MTLEERRASWEYGLKPLSVIERGRQALVILERRGTTDDPDTCHDVYHCHRYFEAGPDNYEVSVDGQDVPLAAVFSWLNDPSAMTTQEPYVEPEPVEVSEDELEPESVR